MEWLPAGKQEGTSFKTTGFMPLDTFPSFEYYYFD